MLQFFTYHILFKACHEYKQDVIYSLVTVCVEACHEYTRNPDPKHTQQAPQPKPAHNPKSKAKSEPGREFEPDATPAAEAKPEANMTLSPRLHPSPSLRSCLYSEPVLNPNPKRGLSFYQRSNRSLKRTTRNKSHRYPYTNQSPSLQTPSLQLL